MTFLVPFDGSDLAKSALVKARAYSTAIDDGPPELAQLLADTSQLDLVAVSIIPNSSRYAIEQDWVNSRTEFSVRKIAESFHKETLDLAPSAQFVYETVTGTASAGLIGRRLRDKALEYNASTVFIGSENAGRIVTPVSSVSRSITGDDHYDIHLVRTEFSEQTLARIKTGKYF
jgi:hypothetical protein